MKIVIIEDEPLIAKDLQKLLLQIAPEAEVWATLGSVAAAGTWFTTHPEPDLVLMDIQLSDGVSFDLFKQVPLSCPIIFTTAYNEYAIRAFKVNSVDYLLKPVDGEDLRAALEKFRKLRLPASGIQRQLEALLRDLRPAESKPIFRERFMAHYNGKLIVKLHPPLNLEVEVSREKAGEFRKWLGG